VLAVFYSEVRMAVRTVAVELRFRWWLRIYLGTMQFLCWTTGAEPNMDRVAFWVKKGCKIVLVPVKANA
jgi:hypothetical protein